MMQLYQALHDAPDGSASPTTSLETSNEAQEPQARTPCRMPNDPLPFWPPQVVIWDFLFFRRLFNAIVKYGHVGTDCKVHVTVMHNVSVNMMDAMHTEASESTEGFFCRGGWHNQTWFAWQDMCHELQQQGCPRLKLHLSERVYITLDSPDSSKMALAYFILMLCLILANLGVTVLASVPDAQCSPYCCKDLFSAPWLSPGGGHCAGRFQDLCALIFTADYLVKLLCVFYIRSMRLDREALLQLAVPAETAMHFVERKVPIGRQLVAIWARQPTNLVDIVSVLPWWLDQTLGQWLPPQASTALRVFRIFRVFRAFKTGRHLGMLQVLGSVLANSTSAIVVLMIFIAIVALISGCLLNTFDPENFSSIPFAVYYLFAELIHLNKGPGVKRKVTTKAGIFLVSAILCIKGVLWILPLGQIKMAFDQADAEQKAARALKESTEYELTRSAWADWSGLAGSARCHLQLSRTDRGHGEVTKAFVATPLLQVEEVSGMLEVPLRALRARGRCWSKVPCLAVSFEWVPDVAMRALPVPAFPRGTLRLAVQGGKDFPGDEAARWCCKVLVPTRFEEGRDTEHDFASLGGGREPEFSGKFVEFKVDWRSESSAGPPGSSGGPGGSERKRDTEFEKGALNLLEEQSVQLAEQGARISTLEALVKLHAFGRCA